MVYFSLFFYILFLFILPGILIPKLILSNRNNAKTVSQKAVAMNKSKLICPNDAYHATEFLAGLVVTIDRLMPYSKNNVSCKVGLSIWQNEDKKTATLSFWYDKDNCTMKETLLENFILDDKFSFSDGEKINFHSEQIINFTPEWVNEMNAKLEITNTFLNSCTYAKVLETFCRNDDGKLFCHFTFGF